MEASFGWGWLSDEMVAAGLEVELSNCYKLEHMRKARGVAKTNAKDAALLSLLPFEPTDWWKVWRSPPAVRDQREWMRYRAGLVAMGTATQLRIRAIFHRHGIFPNVRRLYGGKGRRFLGQLCRDGRVGELELPAGALANLRGQVRLLGQLRRQQAEVERALHGQLRRSPLTRRLDRVPGLGLILSHTVVAEIGQIERFRSHRHLASYSLLAPICQDSGEADPGQAPRGRHLGVHGNLTLKWSFIEAARGAVRKGGRWRKVFDGYTQGGRSHRNRGYIKVARDLVKVVYAMWRDGTAYSEVPPARPGSRRRRARDTRSGTGQLSQPMVAGQ
jgi:transposase